MVITLVACGNNVSVVRKVSSGTTHVYFSVSLEGEIAAYRGGGRSQTTVVEDMPCLWVVNGESSLWKCGDTKVKVWRSPTYMVSTGH